MLRTLLIIIFLAGCSHQNTNPSVSKAVEENPYAKKTHFSADGFSQMDPRDIRYFVWIQEDKYSAEFVYLLRGVASYLLRYRGLEEAMFYEDADYIAAIEFKEYGPEDNQQYLLFQASSKIVYENTNELRPSWGAISIFREDPKQQKNMVVMHAMAMRNFVGGNPTPYQRMPSYDGSSELVKDIARSIYSLVERHKPEAQ